MPSQIRKREKHNLSHFVPTTFDMGQLIPIANFPVLPGDTIQQQTTCLLRLAPMVRPIMHPIEVRIHHWFVPYRIVWTGWEDFITGDSSTPPSQLSGGAHSAADLHGYLGIYNDASNNFNDLHNRAYNYIYNNNYRDQDLISEVSATSNLAHDRDWETRL